MPGDPNNNGGDPNNNAGDPRTGDPVAGGDAAAGDSSSGDPNAGDPSAGDAPGDPGAAELLRVTDVSTDSAQAGSSLSWSHDTDDVGGARLLMVAVAIIHFTQTRTVIAASYGGSALSFVGEEVSGIVRLEVWRLVAPPTGSHALDITFSGEIDAVSAGAITLAGVHQTEPLGPFVSAAGDSTGPAVNVSSAPGELVVDFLAGDIRGDQNLSANGVQDTVFDLLSGDDDARCAASTLAGASMVAMSWTISSAREWTLGAVSVRPVN